MAGMKLRDELQRKPERISVLLDEFLAQHPFLLVPAGSTEGKPWVKELEQFGYTSSDWPKKFNMTAIVLWRGTDQFSPSADHIYSRTSLKTVKQREDFVTKLKSWQGNLGYHGTLGSKRTEVYIADKLIFKAPIFGSTGGSGGGAAATSLGESAQCVYLAAVQYKGHKDVDETYIRKNITKFQNKFDITETNGAILNGMGIDWIDSSVNLANFWTKNVTFKKYLKTGKTYEFHRGSEMVDIIYNRYAVLNKLLDPPFANENKWSPADIWAFSSKINKQMLKNAVDAVTSLGDLNVWLGKQIIAGDVVGISLKKREKGTPHIDEFNMGETKRKVVYTGYKIKAKTGTIFDAKDTYLEFEVAGKSMSQQFRTFDTAGTGWQSEIKGSFANLGKLSHGPINQILKNMTGVNELDTQAAVKTLAMNKTNTMFDDMYKWYSYLENGSPMAKKDFITEASSGDHKWRYSKYFGLQILYNVVSTSKAQAFAEEEVLLALSNSKWSAPFLKLS